MGHHNFDPAAELANRSMIDELNRLAGVLAKRYRGGKPVHSLGMSRYQALDLARTLRKHARKVAAQTKQAEAKVPD